MLDPQTTASSATRFAADRANIEVLARQFRDRLLQPDDEGYPEARTIWNGIIDKRPALIARCADTEDVRHAVDFARENSLPLAVRGGGHNVAGTALCDGGLVIDLSAMTDVWVDPEKLRARAHGGATWADLDRATQVHGLATPGGLVSDTGIAGLTLGGGFGWLRRKYGLSCDNLLSVDIVTADGVLRKASVTENADLFWGLRGGGGGLGVVTSFEYQLHPVGPEVMFCLVLYPASAMLDVLKAYHAYAAQAPDEVSPIVICGTVPDEPAFPKEIHGESYVLIAALHAGSVAEGERVLQPLREFTTPLFDMSGPMPYTEVQSAFDADYPTGRRYYWKSLYLEDLSEGALTTMMKYAKTRPSSLSTVDIWQLGGAMSRRVEDSAFGGRNAPYLLGIEANWEDAEDDDANITWARNCIAEMQPYSLGGMYVNFPGFYEEGEASFRRTYGPNYRRLVALKSRYDPSNLFRLNQNIKPEGKQ